MEHDAWFFIGVFAFIFVIWIATGGPLRSPHIAAPELPTGSISFGTSTANSGGVAHLPTAPYNIGDSPTDLPGSSYYGSSNNGSINNGPAAIPIPNALKGIPYGPTSPFRGLVTMSNYVSNASSSNPNNEYVQIDVSPNAGTFINITNWQLVSETTGKAAVIPQGTAVPTSGVVNRPADIILVPGEQAIIISGRSPIGTSFRENKCIGYLSTVQQFYPYLPQNCPAAQEELLAHYGDFYIRDPSCLEYVRSLSRCEAALFPPKTLSNACKNFLQQYLNYNACVTQHKNDPDFNGTTWHIYLGLVNHLWRSQYEVVKLRDQNGQTVDAFSY